MSETNFAPSLEYEKPETIGILDRSINLTREDPLERLEELCEQGLYNYEFHTDEFQNGVMTTLELKVKGGQTIIIKEARFVKNLLSDSKEAETVLVRAKKIVSAILLDKLDLGVVELEKETVEVDQEEYDTKETFQKMASKGLNMALEILNKAMLGDTDADV